MYQCQQPVTNLQLLSIASIRRGSKNIHSLPATLYNMIKHINVESVENIASSIARHVLTRSSYPCLISGGYAAYKCGRTKLYTDIDIFICVPLGKAHQVSSILSDQFNFYDHDWIKIHRYYYINENDHHIPPSRTRVVIKVPRQCEGDSVYDDHNVAVDIIIEEHFMVKEDKSDVSLEYMLKLSESITDSFDLDICKCVGFRMQYAVSGCNVSDLMYLPLKQSKEFLLNEEYKVGCNLVKAYFMESFLLYLLLMEHEKSENSICMFKNIKAVSDNSEPNHEPIKPLDKLLGVIRRWAKYDNRVTMSVRLGIQDSQRELDQLQWFLMKNLVAYPALKD